MMDVAGGILDYHAQTRHSPASVRGRAGQGLDWPNRPHPFKEYLGLAEVALPRPTADSPMAALETAAQSKLPPSALSLAELAHLLYYTAGVTRVEAGQRPFYFRTYACAGALYPIEVYVVTAGLHDLAAGVYHFHPRRLALRRLRDGDFRPHLLAAAADEAAIGAAPATVVLTGLYWRTTWKYEARGYRHLYWDSGMMLANLLAVAAARGLAARVVLGFMDAEVERLLGLDGEREVGLALVPLGESTPVKAAPTPPAELRLHVEPLSLREVDYPAIRAAHSATRLGSVEKVTAWRAARVSAREEPAAPVPGERPRLLTPEGSSTDTIERVILRRGSTRLFRRDSIPWHALSTILEVCASRPVAFDFKGGQGPLNALYLVVHEVEALAPGTYWLDHRAHTLHRLRAGRFRSQAAYLCLEQPLAADAAAVVFLMADLHQVVDSLGERGYRAAQLEAGILAGRMYLAAYAQRLGATGLTFYDAQVTRFFSPHAAFKDPMLVVAVGRDARRFTRSDGRRDH